ncbi:MAG: flagellin lysine-N-methylase [Lachnospiraceae bacterium]|nr:flagellin lysine-N-methylase [Lachnospiraceae bacterium]
MSIETPVFKEEDYDSFCCLMQKCPDNCCHGWGVPLDDDALKRFRAEKGLFGLKLRLTIHGKEQKIFSPLSLSCPHLRPDGLCGLQKKKGEAFIAEVCRIYPRVMINYGPRAEFLLDLSCIHAASLFLSRGNTLLIPGKEEELPEQYGNNDEEAYFEKLLSSREEMSCRLRDTKGDAEGLDSLLRILLAGSRKLQDGLLKGGGEEEWALFGAKPCAKRLFPLPIADLNEMMSTCFYEEWLKYSLPFLYRICRLYYRRFDRLSYEKGERELMRLFEKHVAGKEELVSLFTEHIISVLLRRYLMSYEDYSPFRHVKEALLACNLFLLFYMLWSEKYGPPIPLTMAHILSVTEKRMFHNEYALKDLLAAVKL